MNKYIANDGECFGYKEEMEARNDALLDEQQEQPHFVEPENPMTIKEKRGISGQHIRRDGKPPKCNCEKTMNKEQKTRMYGNGLTRRSEDKERCIEEVWSGFLSYQCKRKRGYGKEGLYCKQHAKKQ